MYKTRQESHDKVQQIKRYENTYVGGQFAASTARLTELGFSYQLSIAKQEAKKKRPYLESFVEVLEDDVEGREPVHHDVDLIPHGIEVVGQFPAQRTGGLDENLKELLK